MHDQSADGGFGQWRDLSIAHHCLISSDLPEQEADSLGIAA